MGIQSLKSSSIRINYTDVASISDKKDGYEAGLAIFVDASKNNSVEHRVRVVQWDDHPHDSTKSVLSRVEWVVPSTIAMSDTIECKQQIASQIQAGESREEVLAAITELLRSHEQAASEVAAIRKARLTGGKVPTTPTVVMNTTSPANANKNELATIVAMLNNITARLDKLEAGQVPDELA